MLAYRKENQNQKRNRTEHHESYQCKGPLRAKHSLPRKSSATPTATNLWNLIEDEAPGEHRGRDKGDHQEIKNRLESN
jgi:hypothetical protein